MVNITSLATYTRKVIGYIITNERNLKLQNTQLIDKITRSLSPQTTGPYSTVIGKLSTRYTSILIFVAQSLYHNTKMNSCYVSHVNVTFPQFSYVPVLILNILLNSLKDA